MTRVLEQRAVKGRIWHMPVGRGTTPAVPRGVLEQSETHSIHA
jgi:hypothetical protein